MCIRDRCTRACVCCNSGRQIVFSDLENVFSDNNNNIILLLIINTNAYGQGRVLQKSVISVSVGTITGENVFGWFLVDFLDLLIFIISNMYGVIPLNCVCST